MFQDILDCWQLDQVHVQEVMSLLRIFQISHLAMSLVACLQDG